MPRNTTSVALIVNPWRCGPDTRTALANQGTDTAIMTPEQAGAFIRDEIVKWKKVVAAAGVQAE